MREVVPLITGVVVVAVVVVVTIVLTSEQVTGPDHSRRNIRDRVD